MKKRNLFAEIAEGFDALAEERIGKCTLRTHEVEMRPVGLSGPIAKPNKPKQQNRLLKFGFVGFRKKPLNPTCLFYATSV